ncbi:hypothetical protein N7G274_005617 [Stereocaulon virgatum]|uniref:Uncharacterized protein n=1 Tax=Stereocaulon virgatum TaxID=373712 RepID=A0ABR4A815_9LECA
MSDTTTPRFTTDSLVHPKEVVTSQLKDWLEKPQTHEQLAVGAAVSRSYAKTKALADRWSDLTSLYLTARAVAVSAENERTRLRSWLETPQTHEQLVLGMDTSRSITKTKAYFDELDDAIMGKTE